MWNEKWCYVRINKWLATIAVFVLSVGWLGSSLAQHAGDHLVITEVGVDTLNENTSDGYSEYVEIFNPTDQTILLNEGAVPGQETGLGGYFLADNDAYPFVVQGDVTVSSNYSDSVLQFPEGAEIPPGGFVVVTADSDTFLGEFFGGSLESFTRLPGSPQLLEANPDGTDDGVPDMLLRSTSLSVHPWNLTNSGEVAILFYWDGMSDRVQDVDIAVWSKDSYVINKTDLAVDGPDADDVATGYAPDAATGTVFPGVSSNSRTSMQRKSILEPGEGEIGGNGISAHDETTESWGSFEDGENPCWVAAFQTPGAPLLSVDGDLADTLSWILPAAVSNADGDADGDESIGYAADGTLTELYVAAISTDEDPAVQDSLYVAVRGLLFSGGTDQLNASFVLLDLDPGDNTGVDGLEGADNELSDETGDLDFRITHAGFRLEDSLTSTFGFDGAVGMDEPFPTTTGTAGWRTFGTGNTTGAIDEFGAHGDLSNISFAKVDAALFAGAAGTSISAPEGYEAILRLDELATTLPDYVWVAAVVTADAPSSASPNTLPESSGNTLETFPQIIDEGVCIELATGRAFSGYLDQDGDGFGTTPFCGKADGLAHVPGDCDDTAVDVNPDAEEVCDTKDNDCDGVVDEELANVYYEDMDGDGFGDPDSSQNACEPPPDHVLLAGDCDDSNPDVNPDALEVCDEGPPEEAVDNNCDGAINEGLDQTFYLDADSDGYGVAETTVIDCKSPDSYVSEAGDCDDANPDVNPGVEEVCDTTLDAPGIDDNCDGQVDEGMLTAFYADADNDSYGASGEGHDLCGALEGFVDNDLDCNDADPDIRPDAAEVCDHNDTGEGIDNDCDGAINEDLPTVNYYIDNDLDSYGTGVAIADCARLENYAVRSGDCDDNDASTHPNAEEVCDGRNNGCGSAIPEDEVDDDGDGLSDCEGDCDDSNSGINPSADEVCDRVDNNCDGATDENGAEVFYWDLDGDSYGAGESFNGCELLDDWSINSDDCDDQAQETYPGAEERCDTKDNNCDGSLPAEEADADQDGHPLCAAGTNPGDCNDDDGTVYPGADEVCDGRDNDCDGERLAGELDGDADGVLQCAAGTDPGDCDDSDPDTYPGAPEVCDEVHKDNDCDPATDELADADEDGVALCAVETDRGDCNDDDPDVYPGALEICDDETPVDNDCDPETDENQDGDGDGLSVCEGDCDDGDSAIFPEALEICEDDVDQNCDGDDELCASTPTPPPGSTPTLLPGTPTPEPETPTLEPETPTLEPETPTLPPALDTPTPPSGDDDTGIDETPGGDEPEGDGSCQCSSYPTDAPVPLGGALLTVFAAGGLLRSGRRRRRG